jgi:peroxiredoxin Q/BCP
MRDDWSRFRDARVSIVVVAPHDVDETKEYWRQHRLPYIGVPDPDGRLSKVYDQQWKLLKLGRMPALFVIAPSGRIGLAHYGEAMSDIPSNDEVLDVAKRASGGAD